MYNCNQLIVIKHFTMNTESEFRLNRTVESEQIIVKIHQEKPN